MAGRRFFAFALIAMLASAVDARSVVLTDLFRIESAGSAQVSPDGKTIAYRRMFADAATDSYDGDLWIMNIDGTGAHRIADGWSPTWLPDGRLAYFIDSDDGAQLVARTVAGANDLGPETPLTFDGASPSSAVWSRDGTMVAWVGRVERTANPWPINLPPPPEGGKYIDGPTILDGFHIRTGVSSFRDSDRHIFIAPAQGGTARQVTSGTWNVGAYWGGANFGTTIAWDHDGESIIFDGAPNGPDTVSGSLVSTINRVDIATGEITTLTTTPGFWRMPRLSPDGTRIAYVGNQKSSDAFPVKEVRLMNADGSNDRILARDTPDHVFEMEWSRDGDALILSLNREGATELVRLGLDGKMETIADGAFRFYITSISDRFAVGSLHTMGSESEIATIDLGSGEVHELTNHGKILEELDLAKAETIWTTSADGTKVQGWLYRPVDFDPAKTYPLILDIHGGPDAMSGYDFDFRYQDFAARGYLVLTSNPRGSTGYGAAFANGINGGFPGEKDQQDLEAILKAAFDRAPVDRSRVYVMGCSGGGSLSAWLAARTEYFAAAAVMCPVTDWISYTGTGDALGWAFSRFAEPYWVDPSPWLNHSPVTFAGTLNVPTLFAVGANDQRTPLSQAVELYTALKVRGVPTRLLIFPKEGHGPWRSIPSDLMRLQLYIDEWFRTKGHPATPD